MDVVKEWNVCVHICEYMCGPEEGVKCLRHFPPCLLRHGLCQLGSISHPINHFITDKSFVPFVFNVQCPLGSRLMISLVIINLYQVGLKKPRTTYLLEKQFSIGLVS